MEKYSTLAKARGVVRKIPVLLLAIASLLVSGEAFAVTYLKANANEGGDGTSWESAYRNVEEAVKAAATGDNVIYAAGGVYVVTNTMVVTDGFAIYGGFPGLAMDETPECRDVDKYRTVLSGDKEMNDYWMHVVPVFGEYKLQMTHLKDKPLFSEGAFCLPPPFQHGYDSYYPAIEGKNCNQAFKIGEAVGSIYDGIWFSGFSDKNSEGDCISIAGTAKGTKILRCRFIGNVTSYGQVYDNSGKAIISLCEFRFSFANSYAAGIVAAGATRISDCLFEGLSRENAKGGGAIFLSSGIGISVERCIFSHCIGVARYYTSSESNYGGPAVILSAESGYGKGTISDCVISNCFSASQNERGTPLFAFQDGAVRRCSFVDNRYEVKPVEGRAYTLVGNALVKNYHQTLEGCSFRGNVIAAPAVTATEGDYALGIIGTASGAGEMAIVNCTFDSNSVEYAEKEGVTAIASRAIVSSATLPDNHSEIGVVNCTFTGPGDDALYDIVQYGNCHLYPLNVVNCLFMADDVPIPRPFLVRDPSLFAAYDCTIQNAFHGLQGYVIPGIQGDPVPFVREDQATVSHVPVCVPSVHTPGLRESSDVSTNAPPVNFAATYRFCPHGASEWLPLLPAMGGLDDSEPLPIADANGHSRAFGSYTRGAVQSLAPVAEQGVSLTLRHEPLLGVTLSPSSQATTKNGAIQPVTAEPENDFAGWFDIDGAPYSSSNPLEIPFLSSNLVLVAKFTTPKVDVVFDLGEAGTFTGSGASRSTCKLSPGAVFPVVPPYSEKENWLICGWEEFPPLVPEGGGVYHVKAVTRDLRIIHVVPEGEVPAGSDRSGDSWENATDDFFAAYENAALWRGEVWMREGVYAPKTFMRSRSHVAIRGGFAGVESSADEADPVAHPTIITGDRNGDDFWRPNGKDPEEGARIAIWNGNQFNEPNPDGVDEYWDLRGNTGDNTDQFLRDSPNESTVDAVLDGVTITCFGSAAIEIRNPGTDLTLRRCRYLANASKCVSYYSHPRGKASFVCGNALVVAEDCEFVGNHRAFEASVNDYRNRTVFKRCAFRKNHSREKYSCLYISNGKGLACEDCLFEKNASHSGAIGGNPIFLISLPHEGDAAFTNCVFRENRGTGDVYAVMAFARGHLYLEGCQFVQNEILGASRSYYHSAGIKCNDWGYICAYNSYFASNRLEILSSTTSYQCASVCVSIIDEAIFRNCTIVDNVVSNAAGNTNSIGTFSTTSPVVLVNSLVDGSRFYGKSADFVVARRTKGTTFTMVNTIVRNGSKGYKPFIMADPGPFNLANSAISGIDPAEIDTSDNGCFYDIASNPGPITVTKKGPGVRLARGIMASSPYARAGRLVKVSPSGGIYYYDDVANPGSPWRNCTDRSKFSSSVPGLSEDAPPPADAFGAPRREGRIAYGPLNIAEGGTMLMIR